MLFMHTIAVIQSTMQTIGLCALFKLILLLYKFDKKKFNSLECSSVCLPCDEKHCRKKFISQHMFIILANIGFDRKMIFENKSPYEFVSLNMFITSLYC